MLQPFSTQDPYLNPQSDIVGVPFFSLMMTLVSASQQCALYRETLRTMAFRHCHKHSQDRSVPSSHTNYRYLTDPEKLDRLHRLHDESCCLQKKLHRCQDWIAALIAREGVSLDVETTDDLNSCNHGGRECQCSREVLGEQFSTNVLGPAKRSFFKKQQRHVLAPRYDQVVPLPPLPVKQVI